MTSNEQTQGGVVPSRVQPLSVVPMVFHSQQGSTPYYHHYHAVPVVNRSQLPAQHLQCSNNNNNNNSILGYPNHVQIHPFPHHQNQQSYSLHYSSATPPLVMHENHHPMFYFKKLYGRLENHNSSFSNFAFLQLVS